MYACIYVCVFVCAPMPTRPPLATLRRSNALGNVCRLDLLKNFDGTFSEGSALNPAAFTGLRTPTIQWTYRLSDDPELLRQYFQQHLLMDAYPMAPIPYNDHSIQPGSAVVDQAYADYAPLFNAMHGAKWLLSTRPVYAPSGDVAVNIFTIGEVGSALPTLLVPVMLANSTNTTRVSVALDLAPTVTELGWPPVKAVSSTVRHPGVGAWSDITTTGKANGEWEMDVPLQEGCALVRIELHA